jgi:hypothetical protein
VSASAVTRVRQQSRQSEKMRQVDTAEPIANLRFEI